MKASIVLATVSLLSTTLAAPFFRRDGNGTNPDFPNPYPTQQLIANLTVPITKSAPQIEQIMMALPADSSPDAQQAAMDQMDAVLENTMAYYWVGQSLSMANAIASAGYNSTTSESSINDEFAKGLFRLNAAAPSTVKALGSDQAAKAWQGFTIPYNSLIEQLARTDKSLVADLKAKAQAKNVTIDPALQLTALA